MEDQNEGVHQNAAVVRKTLGDYAKPSLQGAQPSILRPTVPANNFMIPTDILTMIQTSVQFDGLEEEDPNAHVALFLEVCDTFKIEGVSDDAIKLRLFPFSLRDRARSWLNSLMGGSITTWEVMVEKFLLRYFPPSKTARLRKDIHAFLQDDGESLYEAWERFKELLRKCPHHGLELWQQVQTFYNGLNTPTKQTIDTTAGGSFNSKTPKEAIDLLEELAMNNYQWPTRSTTQRQLVHQNAETNTVLVAQLDALSSKIDRFDQKNNFNSVDTKFVSQFHPNKSYEEAGISAKKEKKQCLEDIMSQFFAMNETRHKANHNRFKEHQNEIQSQKAMILNIERHLGHIVNSTSEQQHVSPPKQQEEESKRTSEGDYNEG